MVGIMFEIVAGVTVCVVMARVADSEGYSPVVWGGITLALCLASLALPFTNFRILFAGVVAYFVMFVYNLVRPAPP